jgi:hypothetical protein
MILISVFSDPEICWRNIAITRIEPDDRGFERGFIPAAILRK